MRLTALGIPCPWDGVGEDLTLRYRAWFRLYWIVRVARHKLSIHDWRNMPFAEPWMPGDRERQHCDWCGANRDA